MEAATAAPPAEPEQGAHDDAPPTVDQLFRFSTWLHLGPGAENCDEVDENPGEVRCANPLHFHAWCRLPNQFQHRDIRQKALAAKARRTRQLRDPETDAYVILQDELDALARLGDAAREQLIDELVAKDWWRDYLEATQDVQEREDESGEKRYATIDDDQRRFRQLEEMDADERPADEYGELERHIGAYNEAVEKRHREIEQPRREALTERDLSGLIDLIRDERIGAEATAEFMHVYSIYEWLAGTLTQPGGQQKFTGLAHLEAAAPEVLEALKATYDDLERTREQGREAAKN